MPPHNHAGVIVTQGGNPSTPARPPCLLCACTPAWKRHLCRSCYRKLREAGCPLPPRLPRRGGPAPAYRTAASTLAAYVRCWPRAARARLLLALQEVDAA